MAKIILYNLTSTVKRGGIETCFWELGRTLAEMGHQVALAGGQGPVRVHGGLPVMTWPFTSRDKMPNLGSRFRKMAERLSLARRALPDISGNGWDAIVVGKPYDIPAALMARRRGGAKVCYFSGGGEYFPGYAWLVGHVDHLCACSGADAQAIQEHSGARAAVNYYGVDTELFQPRDCDHELARRLGANPDKFVLVSGVRLVAMKGLDLAIKAVAMAEAEMPGFQYLLAGSGDQEARLKAMVKELGLVGVVIFAGEMTREELPALYSLGSAGLFPSREEPLGIAVGEAMACGLPVVASRVGGIPEQVVDGVGRLVPPGDVPALARTIMELRRDPDLAEMGQRARRQIVDNFSWEACAQRLLDGLKLH